MVGKAREVLLKLARHFEGKRLRAYLCPAGVWTNGYGATGKDVAKGVVWTDEQAEARLEQDAAIYLTAAKNLCPAIRDEVHGAIADFAFNLGGTRLAGSTLRRRINAGDMEAAQDELRKWVWAGGRKLTGLVLRREAEASYLQKSATAG
jgi:lysozyme